MSFADELRNITAQQMDERAAEQARQYEQLKQNWPIIIDCFYGDLKAKCLLAARTGVRKTGSGFSFFLEKADSMEPFLDAAGNPHQMTKEEQACFRQVSRSIYNDHPLCERYMRDLVQQITTRFQAEGLEVETRLPDARFPHVDFIVRW